MKQLSFIAKREIDWPLLLETNKERIESNYMTYEDIGERQIFIEKLYDFLEESDLPEIFQAWWDRAKADPDNPLKFKKRVRLEKDPTKGKEFIESNLLREQQIARDMGVEILTLEEAEKEWNMR